MTRYFGVLSSHSASRRKIILKPGVKKGFVSDDNNEPSSIRRISWAFLLGRVFKIDITRCNTCGADISRDNCHTYSSPLLIKPMLHLLGLEYRGPPVAPARRTLGIFDIDHSLAYDEF